MTPGAEIISRALAGAAKLRGFDVSVLLDRGPRDGRGKVRQLAGAALVAAGHGSAAEVAEALALNRAQLSPSTLARIGVTADEVRQVQEALPVPATAVRKRRSKPDYVDPRRDLQTEKRIIAARMAGERPSWIATSEGVSRGMVYSTMVRAERDGTVFPALPPGPVRKAGADRVERVRVKAPARPQPRSGRRPATAAASPRPAPQREPVAALPPPEAVEAFPDNHPAWAPLEGSTPILLVEHERGCRWPVTVSGAREPMVCNQPTHGATPYCEPHAWLGASPAIRATMVRPPPTRPAVRIARPFAPRDLEDA